MRRTLLASLAIVATFATASTDARAQNAGINLGAPVWNGVVADDALKAAIATGATHVRVNFRLDKWSSPDDPGFFAAYDRIVDAITSQGLEVYGLLNDELAPEHPRTSQAFEDQYAAFATKVIDRYKDRVRVWETVNEPNDWAGGTSARIPAAAFARLHGRLYSEVKVAHQGDACWDVKLVTGPLFSFDGNSSASFLDQTIAAGRAGGPWKAVREALGHDPIDDVGYHVYVAQGSDSSPAEVAASANANLDAVASVLAKYAIGGKKIWISEIGYQATILGDQGQAARLDTTFDALGARGDVASIQWFTIGDFGGEGWGLYRAGGFGAAQKRPIHDRLVAQAKAHAPDLAAKLVVELPKQVEVGAKVVAKITATNLGKKAWNGGSDVRLGAASGCPSAWALNGWSWDVASGEGYAKGALDARRFLPQGTTVAQGESIVLEVPLVAPSAPGKQRFAARMVDEGVAWFGSTASAEVDVVPASIGAPSGDGAGPGGRAGSSGSEPAGFTERGPSADAGCGCRESPGRSDASGAARGLAFAGVLGAIALLARRRSATRCASLALRAPWRRP